MMSAKPQGKNTVPTVTTSKNLVRSKVQGTVESGAVPSSAGQSSGEVKHARSGGKYNVAGKGENLKYLPLPGYLVSTRHSYLLYINGFSSLRRERRAVFFGISFTYSAILAGTPSRTHCLRTMALNVLATKPLTLSHSPSSLSTVSKSVRSRELLRG